MRWSEEEYEEFLERKGTYIQSKSKKKNKYRNIKTQVDGITFDSKKEAEYYCKLKLLKQAGEIKDFGLQPRYELQPTFRKNGTTYRAITYVADFIITNLDGTTEVVDIKGVETQVFKIKQKLFEYMYPDLSLKVIK
ncbi:DUF1064 domain-containing protein [Wansuia hejianensis]|uniref:DUF1064 domain-containing protein n=1 Tax=Wansuia hejianensis TaxID=2763667 RepID=UPI0020164027